jgi:hypothetical protein
MTKTVLRMLSTECLEGMFMELNHEHMNYYDAYFDTLMIDDSYFNNPEVRAVEEMLMALFDILTEERGLCFDHTQMI